MNIKEHAVVIMFTIFIAFVLTIAIVSAFIVVAAVLWISFGNDTIFVVAGSLAAILYGFLCCIFYNKFKREASK